jgi:hypothetical protein
MLTDSEIQQALHASRNVPLTVANPHGPLGLEQLAANVARVRGEAGTGRIRRPIALSVETWQKLSAFADSTTAGQTTRTSTSEVAAALLEQFVAEAK